MDGSQLQRTDPLSASVTQQIKDLMQRCCDRWWSPYEVEQRLKARSAPRRMREIMEDDRLKPWHEQEYSEMRVKNSIRGGWHKVYRWKGVSVSGQPDMF